MKTLGYFDTYEDAEKYAKENCDSEYDIEPAYKEVTGGHWGFIGYGVFGPDGTTNEADRDNSVDNVD